MSDPKCFGQLYRFAQGVSEDIRFGGGMTGHPIFTADKYWDEGYDKCWKVKVHAESERQHLQAPHTSIRIAIETAALANTAHQPGHPANDRRQVCGATLETEPKIQEHPSPTKERTQHPLVGDEELNGDKCLGVNDPIRYMNVKS